MLESGLLRVFVASPSDVRDARGVLEQVVSDLNDTWGPKHGLTLLLLDWRKHVTPWLGKPPEPTILQQLPVDTWDLFVGIMWSRLGTPTGNINPATGESYKSGTEEEFVLAYKCHQERGTPKLLFYRCIEPVDPNTDPEQLASVQTFFKQLEQQGRYFGLYTSYKDLDDFRRQIYRHLNAALIDFQDGVRPSVPIQSMFDVPGQWLEKIGLSGYPFTHWNAGTDDSLPKYFHVIAPPYFDELVGNLPNLPQPAIVFGERGMGKTAMCRMIAHESSHKPGNRNVLAVLYTDLSFLAEKMLAGGSISPRDHVEQILRSAMQALGVAVEKGSAQIKPTTLKENRLEFLKYLRHFGQNLSGPQRRAIVDAVGVQYENARETDLPELYVEIFYSFCRAVRIFGYDIVYILVDQLDECSLLDTDEKIVNLLLPLMAELRLMEPPEGLAVFRFFLPARLEDLLRRSK